MPAPLLALLLLSQTPSTPKAPEKDALAALLSRRGTLVEQRRSPVGAVFAQGFVELELLQVEAGGEKARALQVKVTGLERGDQGSRALLDAEELPGVLDLLDEFAKRLPELRTERGAGEELSYLSRRGLELGLKESGGRVVLACRVGRSSAELDPDKLPELRAVFAKAQAQLK